MDIKIIGKNKDNLRLCHVYGHKQEGMPVKIKLNYSSARGILDMVTALMVGVVETTEEPKTSQAFDSVNGRFMAADGNYFDLVFELNLDDWQDESWQKDIPYTIPEDSRT